MHVFGKALYSPSDERCVSFFALFRTRMYHSRRSRSRIDSEIGDFANAEVISCRASGRLAELCTVKGRERRKWYESDGRVGSLGDPCQMLHVVWIKKGHSEGEGPKPNHDF